MTSTIQHYRSTVAGNVPAALTAGRIGINHTDGKLLYRNAAGAVAARSFRDYGVVLTKGDVASVANLTFDITPATIGIMRGFVLRLVAVASAAGFLILRMGDVTSIKSGSTDYLWNQLYTFTSLDYDSDSAGDAYIALTADSISYAAAQTIDMEILLSTNDPTPTMYRRANWKGCFSLTELFSGAV
jgi:hypothetical protein